jgi:translocator protein
MMKTKHMTKKRKVFFLIFAILLCLGAGFIGSLFNMNSIDTWYKEINRPSFTPPDYVFGPVWTLLYIMMAVSLYLVYINVSDRKQAMQAYTVFGVQLFLNVLWSLLFFGLRSPASALVEIIILWAAIALNIYYFQKISKAAALLLVPYILWVTFAAVLNLSFVLLN